MPGARGGARRSAAVRTFLIADIRGYTRFTAQHGDEAASQLARKFAEVAAEGVEAWDGELVELRGDEALAVFDSARQALRCAIELQDAFADETRTRPDLPLAVGIGLDAGEAVPVGDGYRGAALNLAARLCASASAGEVVASADLVHLAGPMPGLTFGALPAKELKGIERAVAAVLVTEVTPMSHQTVPNEPVPIAPPLPVELEPIVPLAGRMPELQWLRWHWRRARNGHGRTVIVSGPPGIGKTRISAELATIAHGEGASVLYLPSARGADAEDLLADDRGQPTLLIVDDLDAAASPLPRAVTKIAKKTSATARLLLITHREEAATALLAVVEPLAAPERRRLLGPLPSEAVRAIAALYAGRAVDELPLREVVEASGGVPAAVHRVAANWARSTATRRLGVSADRTEAGRRHLREAEDALIGDVADLELVRERARGFEPDASEPSRQQAMAMCPYKGLAAFEAVDADYYFGRERLVAELVARLVGNRFLGLVGASGSGKSSALRAGLLPALAGGVLPGSERWLQVIMRPGEQPLAELAQALARADPDAEDRPPNAADRLSVALAKLAPGQELLLAIDQFEEVFGATRDENERGTFIDLLTKERQGLKVVVALRADHYGHCAPYPALARLIGSSHVLVGPLTSAELEAVIEAPAQRVGLRVEPGLVRELIADAGTEPGVLPLLSTSLLELWQARDGGRLTLATYRAGGGLRGAVARLAEAAYADFNPGQAAIARSVFLRLGGPGEGEGVVRRRVSLAELDVDRDATVAQVLGMLTGARLLTTGEGFVEVAHEALLREWPRLQSWLEEDAAGRRLRLHLIGAVRDWEQRGREGADLYRGARLSAALDWASERQVEVNTAERQFLDESRVASEREVERERRTNRRLRGLLVGAAFLLVIAAGTGVVALTQANSAREQATLAGEREAEALAAGQQAETAARFARSRELAASAVSVLDEDPGLSKLLAVAAAGLVPPDIDIESALHQAWAADAVIDRYEQPTEGPTDGLSADLHPDGGLMVVTGGPFGGPNDELAVVDLTTDQVVWTYTPEWPPASVSSAFFSTDGTRVIAGVFWEPADTQEGEVPPADALGVLVWDARTGRPIDRLDAGRCGARVLAVSMTSALATVVPTGPDAAPVCYAGDFEAALDIVDLDTGSRSTLVTRTFEDGTLSRDGRYAAVTDLDDEQRSVVIDLETGKRVLRIDGSSLGQRDWYVRSLSAAGSLLLYGDRPMKVIEVATGEVVATLGIGEGEHYGAAFGPVGSTAYTSGRDSTLQVWDASTGAELFRVPAAGGGRPSATADGLVLVGDFAKKTVTLLDPRRRGELGTIRTCRADLVPAGQLKVAGQIAAFSSICDDGTRLTHVIDLPSGKVVTTLPDAEGQDQELSPDGTRILRQSSTIGKAPDGRATQMVAPLRIHDARTGRMLFELEGMCTWNINFDGPRGEAGECKDFPETPFGMWNQSLEWSPDGRFVVAIDEDFAAWDARTGKLLKAQPILSEGYYDFIFSPDSTELITSSFAGELVAFSTTTWEVTRREALDPSIDGRLRVGFAGFLADGATLVAVSGWNGTGGGSLLRIEAKTLTVQSSNRAHDGSPKAMAVSQDGTFVVTGAADGLVRVWDGPSGKLLHQFVVEGQAQGVAFIDNGRIAATPQTGNLLIMAIDPQVLLQTVRASLTRSFTPEECERFNFGAQCPTLEQLSSDSR